MTNQTPNPGGILRWLTERPARSFTLFRRHAGLVRIARLIERVVFLGGASVAVLLTHGGGMGWVGLLEALIEIKVTALILSQVAHVFVNVVRYILVPSDRAGMRASSTVTFIPRLRTCRTHSTPRCTGSRSRRTTSGPTTFQPARP